MSVHARKQSLYRQNGMWAFFSLKRLRFSYKNLRIMKNIIQLHYRSFHIDNIFSHQFELFWCFTDSNKLRHRLCSRLAEDKRRLFEQVAKYNSMVPEDVNINVAVLEGSLAGSSAESLLWPWEVLCNGMCLFRSVPQGINFLLVSLQSTEITKQQKCLFIILLNYLESLVSIATKKRMHDQHMLTTRLQEERTILVWEMAQHCT